MLFALYDYFLYRFNLDRYSNYELAKSKASILTDVMIPKIPPHSMMLFHTRESFLSWAIMYYTDSIWSHTAIKTDKLNILDATTSGTFEHPLSDYADSKTYYIAYSINAPQNILSNVTGKIKKQSSGSPYGWGKVIFIFFNIIYARNKSYRFRLSLDITLVLYLIYYFLPIKIFTIIITALYLVPTLKNIIIYRKFKIKF